MKKNKALRRSDILYHIIKGWRIIVLFTLIGLIAGVVVIGAGYIRGEVSREYKITSSFAVITTKPTTSKDGESDEGQYNNLTAARAMTDTAIYIVKSEKNMKAVVDDLGLRGVSAGDISRNLSLAKQGETEIVEMTLLWRSEKEGLSIMNSINKKSSAAIADTLKIGSISVINEPKASFIVGGNISISTWVYAAVLGLIAGVGICLLRFLIAPTLINENDVTAIFGIDTLGSLPLDREYAHLKPLQKKELPIFEEIKSVSHLLISHLETARVNKLYITSTIHNEGKTRLLADIAIQLARLGKKTLLIDCDLSNPKLGALFFSELKYEQTLNALYRGDADKLDAILHVNGCLDLLPTVLEKNPEDLNDALIGVLGKVMDGYDYVLIDAAPIGVDAEVLRLNEVTDTVLYVVRYDDAKLDDIKRSMLRIAKSGIPVVGAVFNCVVNWRQTLINVPKRLAASVKREEKKKEKARQKNEQYLQRMAQKDDMEKRPDRRYLDGVATDSKPAEYTPQPGEWAKRRPPERPAEKKRRFGREKAEKEPPKQEFKDETSFTEEPVIEKPALDEPAEKPTAVKKSRSQKTAERKAAEQAEKEQRKKDKKAAEKAAKKAKKKK